MKRQYILLSAALVLVSLSSCSTYKNAATTPDDVYYSPGQPVQTTVSQGNNSEYYSTPNENYVKMRVQNPDKWSYFDDYNYDYYGSSAYGYGSSMGMSIGFTTGACACYGGFGYYSPMSYYNSYYAWNNFYNPYYSHIVVVNGTKTNTPSYTRLSNFNPSAYKGSYYNARPSGMHLSNTSAARNSQSYFNSHNNNSSYSTRSTDGRPSYSPTPSRSTFSSGGGGSSGGGSRGGGFSRPGR